MSATSGPAGSGATERPLRVAAWQTTADSLDVAGNLGRLEEVCARAAEAGADVLLTPEMFVTGYARPADAARLAEPVDDPGASPILDRVAALSRRTGVAIVYGFPELGSDGVVHNSAALVDGALEEPLVGVHRKAHLFGGPERESFAPGSAAAAVLPLRGRRVGLVICYDVEFPETVRAAAEAGADAVLVPTANMAGYEFVSEVLVRARAYETGCHLAYANLCGTEAHLTYAGLSLIASPTGEILAAAGTHEALLIADLTATGRRPDYLRDRRPGLYT